MSLRTWISALRLRTLPLAISGILMGTYTAGRYSTSSWTILFLALLTAVFLQILSNLANDYGDHIKGTDNEKRLGNTRALQSGKIKPAQMRAVIVLCLVICLVLGICLLYTAFESTLSLNFIIFFIIGILAILAAITYTVGKNPYGYSGKGDIMVLLFFGPVAVAGTYFLHSGIEFDWSRDWHIIAPSIAIGTLCTAVLNTNNIRDIENDKASGKHTIPVKIGLKNARIYHAVLISISFVSTLIIVVGNTANWLSWFSFLAYIPIFLQLKNVLFLEPSPLYNQLLKQLSLGTLLLVIMLILTELAGQLLLVSQLITGNNHVLFFR